MIEVPCQSPFYFNDENDEQFFANEHGFIMIYIFRFIEGDFESNISQIRKPHVWGDEPELFIASHVLQ